MMCEWCNSEVESTSTLNEFEFCADCVPKYKEYLNLKGRLYGKTAGRAMIKIAEYELEAMCDLGTNIKDTVVKCKRCGKQVSILDCYHYYSFRCKSCR